MQQTMVMLPGEQFKEELAKSVAEFVLAEMGHLPTKSHEKEEYLTTREVLQEWRVSAPTLRKWRKKGLIKAYGEGTHHMRYRRSEIEAAMAKM